VRPDVLLRSLAEHLGSYVELGSLAAGEYRDAWLRRLLLAVVVVLAGMTGLALAWIAGLIALWDTPWRLVYVIATAVVLLAAAAVVVEDVVKDREVPFSVELLKLFRQYTVVQF
jgi:uncharacterized membrane protein YqjE